MIDRIQFKTREGEGSKSCKMACELGIKWIQLNTIGMSDFDREHEAILCREICDEYKATLIIQNDVELAKRIEADGVHVEVDAMLPMEAREILGTLPFVGATAHNWDQILELKETTVDYISFKYQNIDQFVQFSKDMLKNKIVYPLFADNPTDLEHMTRIAHLSNGGVTLDDVINDANEKNQTLMAISQPFIDVAKDVIKMNPSH